MLGKYESIFILDERKMEDSGNSFIENLRSIIKELGGETLETEEIGNRQLAHPIKKKSSGNYWDVVFQLPKNQIVALKEKFRLDTTVLRLEIFSYDRPEPVSSDKKSD